MRRGKKTDPKEYIKIRIGQLREDRAKAKDSLDRQWYSRIISELRYVLQTMEK